MTETKHKKGALSLVVGKAREFLRFARLRAGIYRGIRADIPADDNFGKALVALAQCQSFHNYVKIGTAHGLGSTKRIADILLSRPDSCCLWSLEASRLNHTVAVHNWQNADLRGRLILIHGTIAADNMMTWEEVQADPIYQGGNHTYTFDSYHKYKKVADDAPDAMSHLPPDIDVLLLDGGELHSYGEYRALAGRAKIICLDDSFSVIKNRRVREEMLADDKWQIVIDNPQDRNGWCIFCRPEYLAIVKSILPQ
ncbi:MAG: hypothetical protein ACR2P4_02415 [Gammaproteobacteria bacterium]